MTPARTPPAGYHLWENSKDEHGRLVRDPFEDQAGPFWTHAERGVTGFLATEKHCNGAGIVHGGCLATLADTHLFVAASSELAQDGPSVTVSLTVNFTKAARIGDWVEAKGKVESSTPGMLFVSGRIQVGDATIATYSGVVKRIKPRTARL